MNKIRKKIFLGAGLAYIALLSAFLVLTALPVARTPGPLRQSNIPSYKVDRLKVVVSQLGKREEIAFPEKLDLSQFRFAKSEPFSP